MLCRAPAPPRGGTARSAVQKRLGLLALGFGSLGHELCLGGTPSRTPFSCSELITAAAVISPTKRLWQRSLQISGTTWLGQHRARFWVVVGGRAGHLRAHPLALARDVVQADVLQIDLRSALQMHQLAARGPQDAHVPEDYIGDAGPWRVAVLTERILLGVRGHDHESSPSRIQHSQISDADILDISSSARAHLDLDSNAGIQKDGVR
mmetsp:Transcript_168347/g.540874  ORF Transcript_168347/g.540874 Transcript_168347/m.540874 type:complete len:208 (-) Transcript_168347:949-1572(-)